MQESSSDNQVAGVHEFDCPVRWSDMDAYGHVNNARFLTYLEEARIDLLFTRATTEGAGGLARGALVRHQEIDYLRPVAFGDPLRIGVWVSRIGGASFAVSYRVSVGATPVATARTTLVRYDLEAEQVRRLDPAERAFLSTHLRESSDE